MDVRTTEVQTIRTSGFVVDVTPEVQTVTVGNSDFRLSFRGLKTGVTLGTTTYSELQSDLNALLTVNEVQVDPSSSSMASAIAANDEFTVTFTGDYGDVPMLISSTVSVMETTKGDAPFRKEIQSLSCMSNAGATSTSMFSVQFRDSSVVWVDGDSTKDQLEAKLSAITQVTVVMNGTDGVVCPEGTSGTTYITFDEKVGDLPLFDIDTSSLDGTLTQFSTEADGTVDGIHPVWGEFTLTYNGETTDPLYSDASALEVETALEALDSIGDVTVWKDTLGLPYASDGSLVTNGSLFSVWSVDFDGLCTSSSSWANCPNNIGDLPLLEVDDSQLQYEPSYIYNQIAPTIDVLEVRAGSAGNTREDGKDLDLISVTLAHETQDVSIATYEVQTIKCFITNATNTSGSFELMFFNEDINVNANTTLADLESSIETFTTISDVSVESPSGQNYVCAENPDDIYVYFLREKFTQPTFEVKSEEGVSVFVAEVVQGIDSLTYLGGTTGRYEIVYTPRVKGNYSISIEINGTEIESDLSSGVYVFPAVVSSPQTVHDARLVATEDVTEPFTIQATDRFGNELDGDIGASTFVVTLNGTAHEFSGRHGAAAFFHGVVEGFSPNTDGIYYADYFPELAGPHVLSVELKSPGGLLATYFENTDLTGEIIGNDDHWLFPYHDPAWYPMSLLNCDSTRLDATIDFDWGTSSPLASAETDAYSGFPEDFFAVRWVGEVLAPMTGTVTFIVATDTHVHLTIGGEVVVDRDTGLGNVEFVGSVEMVAGELYPIQVEYIEDYDEARVHMYWEADGLEKAIVPSTALYHTRHVGKSPVEVMFYPGDVDAATTSAEGGGLTHCVTMTECEFIIQAKDTHNNHIFNQGSDAWVVELTGIDDWAGIGRTNDKADKSGMVLDVTNGTEITYTPDVAAIDWEFLGYANVTRGSQYLYHTTSDFIRNGLLSRGDTIMVGDEVFKVDDRMLPFNNQTVPLDAAFRGGFDAEARLKYDCYGSTTADCLVQRTYDHGFEVGEVWENVRGKGH